MYNYTWNFNIQIRIHTNNGYNYMWNFNIEFHIHTNNGYNYTSNLNQSLQYIYEVLGHFPYNAVKFVFSYYGFGRKRSLHLQRRRIICERKERYIRPSPQRQ